MNTSFTIYDLDIVHQPDQIQPFIAGCAALNIQAEVARPFGHWKGKFDNSWPSYNLTFVDEAAARQFLKASYGLSGPDDEADIKMLLAQKKVVYS